MNTWNTVVAYLVRGLRKKVKHCWLCWMLGTKKNAPTM